MSLRWVWIGIASAVMAGAGAHAEKEESTASPLLHGVLELSLSDAVRMGLENNLNVQVERYAPLIAGFDVQEAWGAYDPTLFAEFAYNDARTPNSFALSGVTTSENRSIEGFGGLRGLLPMLSTEVSAQFEGRRADTNSSIQSFSPEYTSGWSVDVVQPLLKDLFWNQPWTRVRTTKLSHRSSEEGFRQATMEEVQRIEDAYWDLIAAKESLLVANKSLQAAEALLEQTRTRYEVGVESRVEVTQAEAGVSQRQVGQIRAENAFRNQQDVLIDRVLGPNLRATSSLEIRPTDRPDEFVAYEVDVEESVVRAFELRPELTAAQRDVERQELQLSFARNQMLPELDGFFRYAQSGLSGRPNSNFNTDFGTPASLNGFDHSIDDYEDFPEYRVGARLSFPLPNRSARASASKRGLEFARARTSLRRLEQEIVIDVRQAARNLLANQQGIEAARNARLAAEEQLRAEEIRLEYGESTPFEVLQREEDLVEAHRDEIEAFQLYHKSVTALDRAQGTILRNRNIQIAEVAPLR